jgi:hypothetical protein
MDTLPMLKSGCRPYCFAITEHISHFVLITPQTSQSASYDVGFESCCCDLAPLCDSCAKRVASRLMQPSVISTFSVLLAPKYLSGLQFSPYTPNAKQRLLRLLACSALEPHTIIVRQQATKMRCV